MPEPDRPLNPHDVHASDLDDVIVDRLTDHCADIDSVALRLATNLKRAATVLVQREESELYRPVGRSAAAFRALMMVWIFGPVEARDIARFSGFTRQAVSGVLSTLERDGLISRGRGALEDKRLAPVKITAAGRRLVEGNIAQQNTIQADFFHPLTVKETQTLVSLLSRLVVGRTGSGDTDAPHAAG